MRKRKINPLPLIENELYDDEELYWQGQPDPISAMRNTGMTEVFMGVFTAGFALFFIVMALNMFDQISFTGRSTGPPLLFRIFFFVIPSVMCLAGLWHVAMPLRNYLSATRTYYGLTNKRAIIIKDTQSRHVQSFYDENIDRIQTRVHRDGSGDVIFGSHHEEQSYYRNRRRRTRIVTVEHGFFRIPDAREVEDLLTQVFIENSASDEKPKP